MSFYFQAHFQPWIKSCMFCSFDWQWSRKTSW